MHGRRSLLIALLLALSFISMAIGTAHAEDNINPWPIYQCDTGRSGHTNVSLGGNGGGREWSIQLNRLSSPPVIGVDNAIYLSERNGVYCINPDGDIKWRYHHQEPAYSSPALGADGTIYFATGTMESWLPDYAYGLYALDPNGGLRWILPLPKKGSYSSPLVVFERIYIGTASGQMLSLTNSGELIWVYDTNGTVYSSPSLGANGRIYFTSSDGYLYSIWPNGTLDWRYYLGGHQTGTPVIGDDYTMYLAADDRGLFSFTPDGELLWNYSIPGISWSDPALGPEGRIYLVADGVLHAFTTSGSLIWKEEGFYGTPITDSSGLIILPFEEQEGDHDRKLVALYPDGELKWKMSIDDGFYRAGPAVVDGQGNIYLSSDDHLYKIDNDPVKNQLTQLVLESAIIAIAIIGIICLRSRRGGAR